MNIFMEISGIEVTLYRIKPDLIHYTQGDIDEISMPAGFRRHLVGKTLRNVFSL